MSEPFLVIAAGGTGGHMFPAQALAEEMLRRGWRVALSTDERGMRYAGGFPEAVERRQVRSATLSRGGVAGKLSAPFEIMAGVSDAIDWFRETKPAAVAGFGGYPSLPAMTAAWRLSLPRILHEQNGVLGRVNKVFATRVQALACGVEPVSNAPSGAKPIFLGNPIRDDAAAHVGAPYPPLGPEDPINLVVFGGSQGARVFAENAPPAILALPEALRRRVQLSQQVRTEEYGRLREIYVEAGVHAELSPFFEDIPARIAAAHLVVSRAGASSIAELTAIGRPSVLAPYPLATADHQTANARALAEKGAAVILPDAEMTPQRLSALLAELLGDPARLQAMAASAAALGRPNAARDLADLVERCAAQGRA